MPSENCTPCQLVSERGSRRPVGVSLGAENASGYGRNFGSGEISTFACAGSGSWATIDGNLRSFIGGAGR